MRVANVTRDETLTHKPRRYSVDRAHPSFVVEPCPKCDYPEADGGYCPECGQTFRSPSVIDRRQPRDRRK